MVCEFISDSRICVLVFLQSSTQWLVHEWCLQYYELFLGTSRCSSWHTSLQWLPLSPDQKEYSALKLLFCGKKERWSADTWLLWELTELSLHACCTAYRFSDPALNYVSIRTDVLWEWGLWYLNGSGISFIFMASQLFSKQGNYLLCKIFSVDGKCCNH